MIFKKKDTIIRLVDENTKIIEYGFEAENHDLVECEMNGYHGEFKNIRSRKTYYITEGTMEFKIDGKEYLAEKGDVVSIKPNVIHSMTGYNAKLIVICDPVFNPNDEVKVS